MSKTVKVSTGFDSLLLKAAQWDKFEKYREVAHAAFLAGDGYFEMPARDYDEMVMWVYTLYIYDEGSRGVEISTERLD